MATTQERVQKAIAEKLGVDLELVVPSASLIGDLHADSLDLVELTIVMEEEFGVQIPDEDAEKFVTVQDVLTFLREKGVEG